MKEQQYFQEIFEPYAKRFEETGFLYSADWISKRFLKLSRKTMQKQYFYEEKLFFKTEKRLAKWAYKDKKKADKKERRQAQKKTFMDKLRQALSNIGKCFKRKKKAVEPQAMTADSKEKQENVTELVQSTSGKD